MPDRLFKKRTTLILGAGASAPYGMPLGTGLRNTIMDGDGVTQSWFAQRDLQAAYVEARRVLLRSQYASVDDFMKQYPAHADVVKIAIARELEKHLGDVDANILKPTIPDHWYNYLLTVALGDDPQLGDGLLTVVTFNYDLSLEIYLLETLVHRYKMEPQQAAKVMRNLRITHMYGHLGPVLPIHGEGRGEYITADADYAHVPSRIKTCYESGSVEAAKEAQKQIAESDAVIFLGFGYHKENLDLLCLPDQLRRGAMIGGSVFACPAWSDCMAPYLPGGVPDSFKPSDVGTNHQSKTTIMLQALITATQRS